MGSRSSGKAPATPKRKAAPKKAAAKKAAPAKRTTSGRLPVTQVTDADRAAAAEQIDNVTPIRGRAPRNGARSSTSPAALRLGERREKVLNLRRLGLTWQQVADRIRDEYRTDVPKYTAADAYNDHRVLIDSVTVEAVAGVREEDLATLLALQRTVYPAAVNGDWKALDRMLRILDQRAKYLGLYSPIQHELTGTGGGPIELAAADPRVVYDAAFAALDELLPHQPMPELPAPPT